MNKIKAAEKISKEIKNCKICKIGTSGEAVIGEGDLNAKVMFVGEAPGKNEAKVGRPFIGRSGKFLRKLIIEVLELKEEDVYITSPVKYLPGIGTPDKAQIDHGMKHLQKQIELINPKVIVLLGSTAVQAVLKEKVPILKRHGQIVQDRYFLTIHPAAAIRFFKLRSVIEDDFKMLRKII